MPYTVFKQKVPCFKNPKLAIYTSIRSSFSIFTSLTFIVLSKSAPTFQ